MRYFVPLLSLSVFTVLSFGAKDAVAGFEWIPPQQSGTVLGEQIKRQTADQALTPAWQDNLNGGHSADSRAVEAVPLVSDAPTSLFPPSQQEMQQAARIAAMPVKKLSGGKLFIDPYPLRRGSLAAPIQGGQAHKAMHEASGKLNPVRLGSGFSTGAKPKSIPFPKPSKQVLSDEGNTLSMPKLNSGVTPMIGGEIAALPMEKNNRVRLNPAPLSNPVQYAQAIGFGQDLPLALALSQIIPNEFTHSFAKDVDTGASVSWEGGKAWDVVLNAMLRPKNLTAVIQGNQVIIQPLAAL